MNVSVPPTITFLTMTVARLVLVKVQVVVLPASTTIPVTPVAPAVPVDPPPCKVHDGVARSQPLGTVSLTLKPLPGTRLLTVSVPVPLLVVIDAGRPKLLVKSKVSSPPIEFFTTLIEPRWVTVNVQTVSRPVWIETPVIAVLPLNVPVLCGTLVCTWHEAPVKSHPVGTTSVMLKLFVGANETEFATTKLLCAPVIFAENWLVPACDAGLVLNTKLVVEALSPVCVVFLIVRKPLLGVMTHSDGSDPGS